MYLFYWARFHCFTSQLEYTFFSEQNGFKIVVLSYLSLQKISHEFHCYNTSSFYLRSDLWAGCQITSSMIFESEKFHILWKTILRRICQWKNISMVEFSREIFSGIVWEWFLCGGIVIIWCCKLLNLFSFSVVELSKKRKPFYVRELPWTHVSFERKFKLTELKNQFF